MAVTTGHDSYVGTRKAGGAPETSASRWTAVFEQRESEWRIVYETWENIANQN